MTGDPGSLADLRELALPAEPAFWPPAPGAWIIAAAVLALAALLVRRAVMRYRAAAYRRAALAELGSIAATIGRDDMSVVEEVSCVLKRVALVDFPREAVAPLSGPAWAAFLAETAGTDFDAQPVRRLLAEVHDAGRHPEEDELRGLVRQARAWVRRHRLPAGAGGG